MGTHNIIVYCTHCRKMISDIDEIGMFCPRCGSRDIKVNIQKDGEKK